MVIGKASAPELSQRLLEIEIQSMGLAGDRDRARIVAEKLLSIAPST
jgi:hypothetical protein